MSQKIGGLFNFSDRLQINSLNQRLLRNNVITSNIANAETPGFRAIGYSFEDQLQAASHANEELPMSTTNQRHLMNEFTQAGGQIHPDAFVRPTETVPEDGNTVDIDNEMAELAENQIRYRTAVELLNRKIGILRYAITSGGR